jgi:CIC family chloride channel protein
MTAVTMIFEMTLDYQIVLPMIIAVAVALGVRRMLSRENIYTMKLVRRGHPIPKALHANMFLVRSARDVMEQDVLKLDVNDTFGTLLDASAAGGMRHVVVTRGQAIVGALRVNTDLRDSIDRSARLGDACRRNFTVVRENAVAFDVIRRLWRRGALMALVVAQTGRPRAGTVLGVIDKEHIADTVASSVQIYPR